MIRWEEQIKLSAETGLYKCGLTGRQSVLKPRTPKYDSSVPIAANEFIAYELLMLLQSKGLDINIAAVQLLHKKKHNLGHHVAMIEYLGTHSRVSSRIEHEHPLPNWLYWFDKWTARLDCAGDTNLILVNGKVIPVDFAMCFTWAYANPIYCHKVDDFNIPIGQQVKEASSDTAKIAIQSITDAELRNILFSKKLDDFLHPAIRGAYFTGLSYRRDHLQ